MEALDTLFVFVLLTFELLFTVVLFVLLDIVLVLFVAALFVVLLFVLLGTDVFVALVVLAKLLFAEDFVLFTGTSYSRE